MHKSGFDQIGISCSFHGCRLANVCLHVFLQGSRSASPSRRWDPPPPTPEQQPGAEERWGKKSNRKKKTCHSPFIPPLNTLIYAKSLSHSPPDLASWLLVTQSVAAHVRLPSLARWPCGMLTLNLMPLTFEAWMTPPTTPHPPVCRLPALLLKSSLTRKKKATWTLESTWQRSSGTSVVLLCSVKLSLWSTNSLPWRPSALVSEPSLSCCRSTLTLALRAPPQI